MDPFLVKRLKANWATMLQDQRRLLKRDSRLRDFAAAAAMRSQEDGKVPFAEASADDDAVNIDSPTVHHNHNYPASPWPWVVLLAALILAAAIYYGRKAETFPPGPPPSPPTAPPSSGDYIEFY